MTALLLLAADQKIGFSPAADDPKWTVNNQRFKFLIFRFKGATMIRVTGLYRDISNSEFDFDYYMNTHMPLVEKRLAEFGMGDFEVERGLEAADGEAAPYVCIVHIEFPTIDDFKRGFEKHGEELGADVPNYTNIAPEMQISEIVESRE